MIDEPSAMSRLATSLLPEPDRPHRVVILGQPFDIEWVAGSLVDPEKPKEELLGWIQLQKQLVQMTSDLAPAQERYVLLHEVVHGIIQMTGHDDLGGKEEGLVVALATSLLDFLRANPLTAAWLTS